MIISVSAVSAAEDIDDSSDIISIENDAVDEEIQSAADSEIIADDGNSGETATVGNFSSLQKIINDDETGTVELNQNYAFDSENDSSLINGIIINKNITLDGKGHTIDAKNSARIFKLNANDITLKNITFVNAKSEGTDSASYGGAIYSNGAYKNQVISDCKFSNNTAYNGGAIYLGADDSKITGCEFEDNKAGESGGAVFVVGWNATVADSTFNKNNATKTGGAVAWFSTKTGVIEGSTFTNNIANAAGGAVSWQKAGGEITDSTFTANEAPNAGAVYWIGNEGTIKGGKFSKNKATGNLGGAIFADANANATKLTISSTFEENTALNGGAVALYNNAEIVKSQFTNNTATSQGAALFAQATTNLTESVFEKNNPASNSADIYNAPEGTLNLKNNTFDSESPIKNDGQIQKPGSNVTISPIANVTYGNTVVVYYNIVNRSSNVTASVCLDDGNMQPTVETAVIKIIDNETIAITNLTAGKYLIIVFNNEDNNVYGNSSSAFFTVNKADPNLQVTAKVNAVGIIEIDATVDKNVTGNITFKVINETGAVVLEGEEEIENGSAKFAELTVLPKGKYNYTVSYENENYNTTTINSETPLVIDKEFAHIDIKSADVNEYGMIVIKANITKDATGNVTFYFYNTDTGKNLTVPIEIGENGTIDYNELTPFEKGYYYVQIGYNGDNKYYETIETSASADVNVTKTTSILNVYNVTVNQFGHIVVLANVTKGATGNVTYLFTNVGTGKTLEVNITVDEDGVADYDEMTSFDKGEYKINIWYNGDENYYGTVDVEESANITKSIPELDVYSITVNEFGHIVVLANVTKDATGTVTFIFTANDKNSTVDVTIDNGTVKFDDVVDLGKGHYGINTIYNGDNNYYSSSESINETELTKDQISSTYEAVVTANQADITIKFPANATGNITVFYPSGYNESMPINGTVFISEIVENGPQYILVTYPGDKNYYGFDNYKIEFFVKASSFISAKDVNVVYQNNGKVTVTLYDNNDGKGKNPIDNAEIVITLNGKQYKAKTNANGIATVTIAANLVPKAYTATVSYAGTNVTVGDKETFKFTVKKATPKLTAKKKTFKAKTKVKKYTIVLKDNKNKAMKKVKVYLKVKGKTYTAKTNSKGKAVFKIKKLTKKGTYKAKVTFKGSKYFNKVTKTAKIKVKR